MLNDRQFDENFSQHWATGHYFSVTTRIIKVENTVIRSCAEPVFSQFKVDRTSFF